jgi:hypothetical protein
MAIYTGGVIGTCGADNLIAGTYPPPVVKLFDLKEATEIKRGTVLARTAEGKYFVLGSAETVEGEDDPVTIEGTASAIVATDTQEDDTVVEAYVSGLFYRNLLTVAEGYELTEADENNLRLAGILLTDGI